MCAWGALGGSQSPGAAWPQRATCPARKDRLSARLMGRAKLGELQPAAAAAGLSLVTGIRQRTQQRDGPDWLCRSRVLEALLDQASPALPRPARQSLAPFKK